MGDRGGVQRAGHPPPRPRLLGHLVPPAHRQDGQRPPQQAQRHHRQELREQRGSLEIACRS